MKDWFAEKTQQLNPSEVIAFGVTLSSRHGKVYEMMEMLKFAELIAQDKIAHCVEELSYDSKACVCTFVLAASVKKGDVVANKLFETAKKAISQFEWFGIIEHGADFHLEP